MRKPTIEQRIARLEKMISRKSVKNEAKLKRKMNIDLQEVFVDHLGSRDCYDSERDFKENIFALTQGDNDPAVDSAIMYMSSDFGYDEDLLEDLRDDIADALAEMADDLDLDYGDNEDEDDWDDDEADDDEDEDDNPYYDPNDEDEDGHYNFHYWESRKRHARKGKSESRKINRRNIRNEDIKRLPNGAMANRVSDVLAAWADTGLSRPQDAIRELDRKGILDAAVNKWYPDADAVAEAIEDCWDDQIDAVGAGAAQFFIGNIGGITKCSLTLYPVTGGDSRARNLVLKFNWPDEIAL